MPACRVLAGMPSEAPASEALAHPAVREHVRQGLLAMRGLGSGSSTYAARALLMSDAPSVDAGEITDKGYINQAMARDLLATLEKNAPFPVTPFESIEAGLTVMAIDQAMEAGTVLDCNAMWAEYDLARA